MIEKTIACLWACSDLYPDPQFVGAVSESLTDALPELANDLREQAERWYSEFGDNDGPWTFWETYERIECDPLASPAYADALTEERSDG